MRLLCISDVISWMNGKNGIDLPSGPKFECISESLAFSESIREAKGPSIMLQGRSCRWGKLSIREKHMGPMGPMLPMIVSMMLSR